MKDAVRRRVDPLVMFAGGKGENKLKNKEEVKEELQRQIRIHELTECYSKPTVQDAQKIVDLLDGNLQLEMGAQVETVCYYITLLFLEKQT